MRPEYYIYLSAIFSNWGDRMWMFAIALYLVKITPGSLQLSAIFGLVLSFSAIIFSPMVGDWIDRNARLKVVRTLLFFQNMLVIVCAIIVLLFLYEVSDQPLVKELLKTLIIISGSAANLAGQGEKIAVGRDWVVVISRGSRELLARTNAVVRAIDQTVAILSPIVCSLLMYLVNDVASIIFICSWNVLSMFAEYMLLLKVYHLVPELKAKANNQEETSSLIEEREKNDIDSNEKTRKTTSISLFKPDTNRISNWNILGRFKTILLSWKVYYRQNVFLAGLALSMLFLTVIAFGPITTGYAKFEGLSEVYISLCMGLGSIFGILGTFIFPRIRSSLGLSKTGMVGFLTQCSMLLLCVASIWLPGSPSNMYEVDKTKSSPNTTSSLNLTVYNSTPVGNVATKSQAKSLTSICVLMAGIILSRTGLWISDLTVTQLQQENIPEEERGIVGGVQYSLNCILDLVRFALTIILPLREHFGILILISFASMVCSVIIYAAFLTRFSHMTKRKREESIPISSNRVKYRNEDEKEKENIRYGSITI